MMNSGTVLLTDIRLTLLRLINEVDSSSLEVAFIKWICPLDTAIAKLDPPQEWSMMDYRQVAHLGFLCELEPDVWFSSHKENIVLGLKRLIGRSHIMMGGTVAPFSTDVVALIGLASAARAVGGETEISVKEWMSTFLAETTQNLPSWKKCVAFCALKILDSPVRDSISIQGDNTVVKVALGLVDTDEPQSDDNLDNLLKSLSKDVIEKLDRDPCLAGLRLGALNYIINSAPVLSINKPTVEELKNYLLRLPAAFRRWTWEDSAKTRTSTAQKWNIQNEYHVQNLLYFILSPIFPDLEDEFYLEQIGQKNARADLGIPALQLIIEVKFLRPTVSFQDMIGEIAEDNSLYFQRNSVYSIKYNKLLAFVWDDSQRNHEHDKFIQGVNNLNNVIGAVVLSRPGIMKIH